jgi:UDP-N-acetylmuramate dehydrogenase
MNAAVLQAAGCGILERELLSRQTTFQLGGPCKVLIACATPAQLQAAIMELHRVGEDCELIGGGSNLLVADAGLPVAVIRYHSAQPIIEHTRGILAVSGSTQLDDVAAFAARASLGGVELFSGIPGTLGGAIAGNAGAFGKQIGDVVEEVTLMDRAGRLRHAGHAELRFAYRSSALHPGGEIVVAARLRLPPGDAAALAHQRNECLMIRRQKHPDWHVTPTAGSFFRNVAPTSAAGRRQAAGWFLEQAGALEMRINGARPFEKHANIIVRDGECSAQDVLDLSRQMAAAVAHKFNLQLEREVCLLGPFA